MLEFFMEESMGLFTFDFFVASGAFGATLLCPWVVKNLLLTVSP